MKTIENKSRRDILLGAAAVAATFASDSAFSASEHNHDMHNHASGNQDIIDAALDCVKTGMACNDHCIELLKDGDTSIVNCMDVLSETLAMCTALSQMASYQSSHLAAVAKVCISVCEDCEKECRKHEKKHAACKACAESCKDCIDACKKIA
ncbi:MAG: four-helix bundle copper-binding protein [Gammaproteobacteria bacterium]|nr:four-helix bundle copper-binding protein [Gammaproteobacteria bacterium]MCW8922954.1 four-helix bundle copper-binding protein [Gammaproteobacteria bacterium]